VYDVRDAKGFSRHAVEILPPPSAAFYNPGPSHMLSTTARPNNVMKASTVIEGLNSQGYFPTMSAV
jgi:hypothetical protein